MKVLALPRFSRNGASSRYRLLQYIPYLQEQGFEIDVAPLLDASYLNVRYSNSRRSYPGALSAYARRVTRMWSSGKYDLVWVQNEFLPWIPWFFEKLLAGRRVPYVVDYDDAVFHAYDTSPRKSMRWLLGSKISNVMRNAAIVVAGNGYIAEFAKGAGASRVEVLPTVVDLSRYPRTAPPRNEAFTIGWIGTPITARLVRLIEPALCEFLREGNSQLRLIGAGEFALPNADCEVRPWSEEMEATEISQFDVGIMPLPDEPWERGKCGLKLIQYMACARPVIGSPVGVNRILISNGVNGFQAETTADWLNGLRSLRQDVGLRATMGCAGRELVEAEYSLALAAPRLADWFRSLQRQSTGGKAKRTSAHIKIG